jgi:hypothetical protein
MGYNRCFTILLDENTARERIISYYTLAGYELLYGVDTVLKFERGSFKGLYPSSSPIKWYKVKVIINSKGEKSKIIIDIESEYQERNWADPFIVEEIKNLEIFLAKNEFIPTEVKNSNWKIAFSLLRYHGKDFVRKLGFWLCVAAIAGIVGGILAENYTNNSKIPLYIGFYLGFLILTFVVNIWHKWRKRNTKDITAQE